MASTDVVQCPRIMVPCPHCSSRGPGTVIFMETSLLGGLDNDGKYSTRPCSLCTGVFEVADYVAIEYSLREYGQGTAQVLLEDLGGS